MGGSVGSDLNRFSVYGGRAGAGARKQDLTPLLQYFAFIPIEAVDGRRNLGRDHSANRIHDDFLSGREQLPYVFHSYDGGNAQRPRQNYCVRGRARMSQDYAFQPRHSIIDSLRGRWRKHSDVTSTNSTPPGSTSVTLTAASGNLSHSITIAVNVVGLRKDAVVIDLSSAYNLNAIYSDGSKYEPSASADGEGFAYSKEALGTPAVWDGIMFHLGPPNVPDAAASKTISLPEGNYSSLKFGVEGSQESQPFTVTYADGSTSTFSLSLSDWYEPNGYKGEGQAVIAPYRLVGTGSKDPRTFYLYGYSLSLDKHKAVRSIALPENEHVLIFALSLVP